MPLLLLPSLHAIPQAAEIVALNLSSKGLHGVLPLDMPQSLGSLQHLDLSSNQLSGVQATNVYDGGPKELAS